MSNVHVEAEPAKPSSATATDKLGNSFRLKQINCPVCHEDKSVGLGQRGGKYQRLNLGIETTIVRCLGCGLLYPNPFPFPVDPQRLYGDPDQYFEHHSIQGKVTSSTELLKEISRRTRVGCPAVLDVGSGRGEFLKAARDSGLAKAVGLEFSQAMVEYARSTWRIDIRRESIEDHARDNPDAYDAVVLSAVLEHVYRPDLMIAAAARLLRRNGVLYIDCPNEPNLITMTYAVIARARCSPAVINLAPTFSPFHVFGFNPRSLTSLLNKNGFKVESVSLRGGPMRFKPVGFAGALKVSLANAVNAVANVTGTAHNMLVWARRS
jgi:SAM-dependent methyltransferase